MDIIIFVLLFQIVYEDRFGTGSFRMYKIEIRVSLGQQTGINNCLVLFFFFGGVDIRTLGENAKKEKVKVKRNYSIRYEYLVCVTATKFGHEVSVFVCVCVCVYLCFPSQVSTQASTKLMVKHKWHKC